MMDRSREPRRVSMAASNGLSRRRHRSSSSILRESPEDDGPVELHESAGGRLRDRGGLWKKDRDRERDRDRDRDRERERDRDRGERERDRMMMMSSVSSRSKRRRGERLSVHHHNHHHGGGHHMGGDDSSEESVNEDEDEDEEDGAGAGGSMRMLPPNHNNPSSSSIFPSSTSSFSNHNHHHNHQQNHHGYPHRKSFPPQQPPHPPPTPPTTTSTPLGTTSNKVFRSSQMSLLSATVPAAAAPPWASDEMIGVSVPRKARSAHTKRSHETWASSGAGAVVAPDQIHRQASASPVRSGGPGVPGILASASASPALAPVSPSSSNASAKKKMKPNGSKQRPPKSSSSKSASSVQDEIEIEIAEVLYGLKRQPQGPTMTPKQESLPAGGESLKFDLREATNNKPAGDAKSRVSSPISNSPSTSTVPAQPSSSPNLPFSSSAGAGAPMSAIAPKRKRPRPVKYEDENPTAFPVRNSPILSAIKVDADQPAKAETCSPNSEKIPGSVTAPVENGGGSYDLPASQATAPSSKEPTMAPMEPELDLKPALTKELEARDMVVGATKEEPRSPKEESPSGVQLDDDCESLKATKSNYPVSEVETLRGEKFEIDLMAPPPLRSSPDRDSEIDFVAVGTKPMVTEVGTELKPPAVKDNDKGVAVKVGKEDINLEPEEKRAKVVGEEVESQKPVVNRERHIDLQLDLEKTDRDNASGTKLNKHVHKQQQQLPNTEKSAAAQTSPLPLPMSMAGWPGGLPHMGYMAPLQVVSMEGNTLPSAAIQPPHLPYSQQRPKRCATHCYIARHIHYLQQLSRMSPFWSASTGSALPYATKMNVLPSTELHASRGVNSMQEKGQQGLAIFPCPSGQDKNTPAANTLDPAQRKQILLQQPLPAGAPSTNILHGPTFIFPLSQQAAAASIRPGTVKSPTAAGGAFSSSSSNSASIAASATAVAGATAMSFNYPNMAGNETPYLAILQNGAYPIPIPAHVGTTPAYRGTHPQAIPFFNGSFYSTQMLHPSQLQPQQQQPPPSQSQVQQSQRGHQNPSISSGSSSSQKHLQSQQQKSHSSGVNGGGANLQGFPAPKNQSSQSLQFQQRQQLQNHNVPHQARQVEGELGSEDSPSTADSRVSRANTNIYGQNFVVPIQTPNFAFMNSTAMAGANGAIGNPGEKKQLQPQSQGLKAGVDSLPSQAFPMSFASINGPTTAPAFDISSIAQNPGLLQTLPEAARHNYHFVAASAAHAQQQKKSYRVLDDGKTRGNDASNTEEERKAIGGGKAPANTGQSIAFSRPDLTDASVTSMPGNTVIDSSARSLNLGSAASRTTGSVISPAVGNVNAQQQLQRAQQQQQIIQLQKQHQQFPVSTPASVRGKTAATSNGSVYSDHISSSPSSVAAKFSGTLSTFPQSSSSAVQSPQWKNSVRTTLSQVPSSLASNSPALKNLPQQQSRTQQNLTQISFGANSKSTPTQQNPNSNQSPSSPMVVGSPTTSISKGAGGSPRTTSTSTGNKGGQTSTLSSQQVKNTASLPAQKSSPVGGRNVPSILGHPQTATSSPSSAVKPQLSQQQLSKLALPPSQMVYSGSYIQSQAPHAAISTNAGSGTGGFYLQRHRGEQQQPQGSSTSSSSGMLSLSPQVTLTNVGTTDPAKAAAAAVAASNIKGGALPYAQFAAAPSSGKPHQLVQAGFPCVHALPAAVHVKPADQKQPAGE